MFLCLNLSREPIPSSSEYGGLRLILVCSIKCFNFASSIMDLIFSVSNPIASKETEIITTNHSLTFDSPPKE